MNMYAGVRVSRFASIHPHASERRSRRDQIGAFTLSDTQRGQVIQHKQRTTQTTGRTNRLHYQSIRADNAGYSKQGGTLSVYSMSPAVSQRIIIKNKTKKNH